MQILRLLFLRLASAIPVVLVVVTVVFLLVRLTGDPATILAGDMASPEVVASVRADLGLDRPLLGQYAQWLWDLLQGNLGTSIVTKQPVATLIGERLESTLVLSLSALVVTVLLAVPLGVLAVWRHNTLVDRVVMIYAVIGFSLPSFVVGYLLILMFSVWLGWLPVQGYVSITDDIWLAAQHLVLPTLALAIFYMSLISRVTRASVLEVLNEDFVRTAKAKGVPPLRILSQHVLRNAAIPIVTVIGIGLAFLISGVVITESVFNLPGLGRLTIDAVLSRDYPVVQGVILFFACVYILVNLLIDMLYVVIDPRIRY
ncbi:ABC transporter permease [Bordetella bronchiseptica]